MKTTKVLPWLLIISVEEYKDEEENEDSEDSEQLKDSDGNRIFKLSHKRRVTVKLMNGKIPLIDIREFYTKDDEEKPGRKGISLTKDQWKTLMSEMKNINEAVNEL